jgi:neural Wiskott-Aldrich syndrome protein
MQARGTQDTMTQDHNKKSLRQFQCRDYLWEIFEQMGAELECSTDYLINEAMRQYARSRNWGSRGAGSRGSVAPAAPLSGSGPSPGGSGSGIAPSQVGAGGSGVAPNPAPGRTTGMSLPSPITSSMQAPGRATTPSVGSATRPPLPAPPSRGPAVSIPPPLPGGGSGTGSVHVRGSMPSLFVIFNGQKVPVNKEEFVIGRGSKTADLAIKDGNISRRHAAIVLQNGAFYMKDLGSTNGVEFNGARVDSRRIEEGDVYQMCDYELRFTYQP